MPGISPNSVAVLGVPFNSVTMEEAVTIIEQKIDGGGFHQVATANVDFLMHAINDHELQNILCSCSLVVPDGMPILWSARLMGSKLKERVCGIDLVPRLAELAERRGYRLYLLGASEKSSQRAAEQLQKSYPGLHIVGRYSPPPRPLEEMNHEEILQRIEQARPDILLVAFGNPKQEKWLSMHRDRLKVPVSIGIGGSLDMIAGKLARAPRWMQKAGLEWSFRAVQEPRRLIGRYISDAITLGRYLPQQMAATASQPRTAGPSNIFSTRVGNTEVIAIQGNLTGRLLADFERLTRNASEAGMHIVLNMAQSGYFGPNTLGSLVQLMTSMQRLKLHLWLAEMRPHLVRLLRSSRLDSYFKTTSSVSDALYRIAKADYHAMPQLPTIQTLRRKTGGQVHVRLEMMQDVCQRMAAGDQGMQLDFGGGFSHASRYGFKVSVG
ncbi:MAG TPA: WecB/TagA/CpsF family glycosyltransferase [Silvibacterium sp.]|jgi:N-acetylglucosaminyldiphosphoundecaprenol N-acetyl-beta-D-mannosaminyltransferase|nr:WecB/TagA/CpsF family glycosyltransferase [Silvibacterium sp.]